MRHRKRESKLGRRGAHRDLLVAGLVCDLIGHGKINTTIAKAKAARVLAEKMVTLGKAGDLSARRKAIAKLRSPSGVSKLFSDIAPGYSDRAGGYTRILRIGKRGSDGAETALLEWTS